MLDPLDLGQCLCVGLEIFTPAAGRTRATWPKNTARTADQRVEVALAPVLGHGDAQETGKQDDRQFTAGIFGQRQALHEPYGRKNQCRTQHILE